jgi:hypothetical protein
MTENTAWNKAKAAHLLGIDSVTIYRKIERYNFAEDTPPMLNRCTGYRNRATLSLHTTAFLLKSTTFDRSHSAITLYTH